jgi:hypothetical protein
VAAGVILLTRTHGRLAGVGLVAAYLLNLGLNHWLAAAIYLQPTYSRFDPDVVAIGFQQSLFAVIGFGLGCVVVAPMLRLVVPARQTMPPAPVLDRAPARLYIAIGLTCLLVVLPRISGTPTLHALVAQGWNLLVTGLALAACYAWQRRRTNSFLLWLAMSLCLPLFSITYQGFLGFGTVAALAILTFIASFARPRWKSAVVGMLLGFAALSLYVTYMRDRVEIRDVVWGGESVVSRIERVGATLGSIEWFDVSNNQHLDRIDERLNQNFLIGSAVQYLNIGLERFAGGETLWNGLVALVPRAIWPSKPIVAGGGDLVSRYTGMLFAEGTSVGIGNVMEAYISFGRAGVVLAFIVIGAAIGAVDAMAGQRLRTGNWRGFVLWYLPGLSLLQVGGSFVEVTSSVGAAWLSALLLTQLRQPVSRQPRLQPRPASAAPLVRV